MYAASRLVTIDGEITLSGGVLLERAGFFAPVAYSSTIFSLVRCRSSLAFLAISSAFATSCSSHEQQ
jgi:hypothetical protein